MSDDFKEDTDSALQERLDEIFADGEGVMLASEFAIETHEDEVIWIWRSLSDNAIVAHVDDELVDSFRKILKVYERCKEAKRMGGTQ